MVFLCLIPVNNIKSLPDERNHIHKLHLHDAGNEVGYDVGEGHQEYVIAIETGMEQVLILFLTQSDSLKNLLPKDQTIEHCHEHEENQAAGEAAPLDSMCLLVVHEVLTGRSQTSQLHIHFIQSKSNAGHFLGLGKIHDVADIEDDHSQHHLHHVT